MRSPITSARRRPRPDAGRRHLAVTAGGTTDDVVGLLKTGKEAEVFVVERRTPDGRTAVLAHKRHRPMEL